MSSKNTFSFKYNTDANGNPISVPLTETLQVSPVNNVATLTQIPDEFHRLVVKDKNNNTLSEVMGTGTPTTNTYKVNYNSGLVFFHESRQGQSLIFNYHGRGWERIGISRVMLDDNELNIDTYGELIEQVTEGLVLVNSVRDTFTKNEKDRQDTFNANEQTRASAENTRKSNETTRQSKETQREQAEETRQATFNTSQTQRQTTFNQSQTAKQNDFNDKMDEWDSQFESKYNGLEQEYADRLTSIDNNIASHASSISTLNNTKTEVTNARGGKSSLSARLQESDDKLDKAVNDIATNKTNLGATNARVTTLEDFKTNGGTFGGNVNVDGDIKLKGNDTGFTSASANHLQVRVNGTNVASFNGTGFSPNTNASTDLGGGSNKWNNVHGVNGYLTTVNASSKLQTGDFISIRKESLDRDMWIHFDDYKNLVFQNRSLTGWIDNAIVISSSSTGAVTFNRILNPSWDGGYSLGTSSNKWGSVHAVNGMIQTSDMNMKSDIRDIDDEIFFDMIKNTGVHSYVLNYTDMPDDITQEEAPQEQVHVGIIAQELAQNDGSEYILNYDEEAGYSVNNYNLTSALMAGLKVEITKREALEERVEKLEALIETLVNNVK